MVFPNSKIRLYSGVLFDPFEPDASLINIGDIAHALSHTPRFAGHTDIFYSVGQHSLWCYERCYKKIKGMYEKSEESEILLQCLMHDASEAYLLDMPSPIKNHPQMKFYKEKEKELGEIICDVFRVKYPFNSIVKEVDNEAYEFEKNFYLNQGGPTSYQQEANITPEKTKRLFLLTFNSLTNWEFDHNLNFLKNKHNRTI